jgi:O-antigen biosynthesis protein
MPRIRVGIYVHAEPQRLRETLASLRQNTRRPVDLLLLPDGPDLPMRRALAAIAGIPQLGAEDPQGVPACFNRLVTSGSADLFLLLESGALPAPGWIDYLVAAVNADPRNGLAGPSTNRCWNEQALFPKSGGSPGEIERAGRAAASRFGLTVRTLEPLYSLADFCYLVRREVVEAIGLADERYGLGPCWEMDYNIRAARAGFRGVWACASYVHRAPITAWRQCQETLRFEASKRLYQDKFCGARLTGRKTDYRDHCRGDACADFAPPALIELRPQQQRPAAPPSESPARAIPPPVTASPEVRERSVMQAGPLATCIMPTSNRRLFVPQAIRCFLRQDYANCELLILDDGSDSVADIVPEDSRVRYVRLEGKRSLGAKRNLACEQARGDFLLHWDDDDWYPASRVRVQVEALLSRCGDLCGSSRIFFQDPSLDRAWLYEYTSSSSAPWVAGSTLAYRKQFWERNRFAEIQVGEDSRFLQSAASKTVCDLRDPGLCVATIHSANTSPKHPGGAYWIRQAATQIHQLLGDDRHFYKSAVQLGVKVDDPGTRLSRLPLVSCIMPTYNRRPFVPLALSYFESQDYPNKELIVLDDGSDPVGDLVEGLAGVRYLRLPARVTIGAKRNQGCAEAQGEIVAHWDDDDWYAPDRLRYQVAPLLSGEADVTGLVNAFVLALPDGVFWTTQPRLHQRMFVGDVHGGTLVYRKTLWQEGLRYPDVNLAEDAALLQQAMGRGRRLVRLANPGVFVYLRHGGNAWRECKPGTFLDPTGWLRLGHSSILPEIVAATYKSCLGGENGTALWSSSGPRGCFQTGGRSEHATPANPRCG